MNMSLSELLWEMMRYIILHTGCLTCRISLPSTMVSTVVVKKDRGLEILSAGKEPTCSALIDPRVWQDGDADGAFKTSGFRRFSKLHFEHRELSVRKWRSAI